MREREREREKDDHRNKIKKEQLVMKSNRLQLGRKCHKFCLVLSCLVFSSLALLSCLVLYCMVSLVLFCLSCFVCLVLFCGFFFPTLIFVKHELGHSQHTRRKTEDTADSEAISKTWQDMKKATRTRVTRSIERSRDKRRQAKTYCNFLWGGNGGGKHAVKWPVIHQTKPPM